MDSVVMIVASSESFIIKGIETKIRDIGMKHILVHPNVRELKKRCDEADLFIFFGDENISEIADALVLIREHCFDSGKGVIVVGTKAENEELKAFISDSVHHRFFERPFDMEKLVDAVEKFMASKSSYVEKKSILIVDDDVSYMSVISDWLKGMYRVSMVNSGLEAISWLVKNDADLILLDYDMPVVTGPQVLEMLRSNPQTAGIPVVFLTGKNDRESVEKVLALKPEGYILKTVGKLGLRDDVAKIFAHRPLY